MKEVETSKALDLASLAGHILLENGAEISRVEETMERIATHYGVDSSNFFVLSNGIFTTARSGFAKVEFIPFKGAQLERVAAVNQLSRDIVAGKFTIEQAHEKLLEIRQMSTKTPLTQILGSAVGSAGFCMIFGGGLLDAAAAFVAGALLWAFVVYISAPHMSKIFGNILGAALATALCMVFHRIGFGESLGNMVIGSLIPLVPGVPFTNGIRDIVGEDYLAGTTRLLDALLVFFCIALGVMVAFVGEQWIEGSMMVLHGTLIDPLTSEIPFQILASFVGTIGFAVLFGVPSRCYIQTGICGALGWMMYLALMAWTSLGIAASTFFATMLVVLLSQSFARIFKTPTTVFLVPGIFPMVPGGMLFWTAYYISSDQMHLAFSSGFMAVKITIAIVLGIVVVSELPQRWFRFLK